MSRPVQPGTDTHPMQTLPATPTCDATAIDPTATTGEATPNQSFAHRVEIEKARRTATADAAWLRRSPTDARALDQIHQDAASEATPVVAVAMGSLLAGIGGGLAIGLTAHPALVFMPIVAGAGSMVMTMEGVWKWPGRLSRRYRAHEAVMADSVSVPAVAGSAFDDVRDAAAILRSLSAPDMAIAYAVDARQDAAEALVALAALAEVSEDAVWLATTDPYQRLLTLAAEVTVLQHLCKDRLALPHTPDHPTMLDGLQTAEEVGAYLLSENQTVSRALTSTLRP